MNRVGQIVGAAILGTMIAVGCSKTPRQPIPDSVDVPDPVAVDDPSVSDQPELAVTAKDRREAVAVAQPASPNTSGDPDASVSDDPPTAVQAMSDKVVVGEEIASSDRGPLHAAEPAPNRDQKGQQGGESSTAVSTTDATPFRLLIPTTSGIVLVDVQFLIDGRPLTDAFETRIRQVMDDARDEQQLSWPVLLEHVGADPQQFGRAAMVNDRERRNVIRAYDRNQDGRADYAEVARFLFRNTPSTAPFRLRGSDFYREVNRTQSLVFAALDANGNRVLENEEFENATSALLRLDQNGDRIVDSQEVIPQTDDADTAWSNRRSSRWGEVAMDLSGYVDWQMLAYTIESLARRSALGRKQPLIDRLDQDGDGSLAAAEAEALREIEPDVTLSVHFSNAGVTPVRIEVASIAKELLSDVQQRVSPGQVTVDGGSLRLIAKVSDGRVGRNQIPPEAFAALDADNDGGLDENEIPAPALQEYSFEDLDQDADGKLTLQEINEGMSPKSPVWSAQVRGRGAEIPDALFGWLDLNQDQLLSEREVFGATDRLRAIASQQNEIAPTAIPETFVIHFGRGDPSQDQQLFEQPPQTNSRDDPRPQWARSMDRNRDGDISRHEFPGSPERFRELDADGDGYLAAAELK